MGDVMPTDLDDVTQVELLWIEKRIENRIRFGHIIHQTILDGRRRRVSFAPGSIFAFVRWASNHYGTVVSRIHILRAVAPGERYSTVSFRAVRWRDPAQSGRLAEGREGISCHRG